MTKFHFKGFSVRVLQCLAKADGSVPKGNLTGVLHLNDPVSVIHMHSTANTFCMYQASFCILYTH